jgi:tetratricopeptide (TPR) repeat protein
MAWWRVQRVASGNVLARAEDVLNLAQDDPERALEMGRNVLAAADGDVEASIVTRRAMGLAARELQRLAEAESYLRTAVRAADRAGLDRRAGECRLSLALVLSYEGRHRAARRTMNRVFVTLRGVDAAGALTQHSLMLQRMGRMDDALDGYRRALPVLRRHGDRLWETRLLANRGLLFAYRGQLAAAARDEHAALALAHDLGRHLMAAQIEHNIGFIVGRAGDVPEALRWLERAKASFRALRAPLDVYYADRAALELVAGLADDARSSAKSAARAFERAGNTVEMAEAQLLAARAALATGRFEEARLMAAAARESFASERRASWALTASSVALMASVGPDARSAWVDALVAPGTTVASEHRPPAQMLKDARRVARELRAAESVEDASAVGVLAGRMAIARGELRDARGDLAPVIRARRRRSALQRMQAWHATALVCLTEGDMAGGRRALVAGMRVLERHQAVLGATELRASAAAHGADVADLGVRLALAAGDPKAVIRWAERWRATALRLTPVRPSEDVVMATLLGELRTRVADARRAAADGRSTARMDAQVATLEEAVRRRAHGQGAPHELPRSMVIDHDALGAHGLVEFVGVADRLYAVVMAGRRTTLHALGPSAPVAFETDALRRALRDLAKRSPRRVSESTIRRSLEASRARLDDLLLKPVRRRCGDRPIVIVPTAGLHGVPWGAFPSLSSRPVSIAPSAATWMSADGRRLPGRPTSVVAVAGPGLDAAESEVDAVAARYPRASVLAGSAATTAATLSSLDGADIGHVAAHGRLRADGPLFSSLTLYDGPLTAYDFERLRSPPPILVLSSCNAAINAVRAGDEWLGLSTALLSVGTRATIAPVVPVADDAVAELMGELHDHLASGVEPASAVARLPHLADAPARLLAASLSFVCLGAGTRR